MTSAIFHYILMGIVAGGLIVGGIYLARNDMADTRRRK